MGRYVGNKWVESLPSTSSADQVQGNNQPVGATSSGGGGGGGGAATAAGAPQTYGGVSSGDIAAIQRGLQESSGLSIKQLNEQIRQFDAQMAWQKQMWEQQGLPQLAIQQRTADLEERKFSELTSEATRQQNWVEEIGRRQATLAEKTQSDANTIAQGQLSLGQQNLGLDVLKTASSLSGPADWLKAANFARGVSQTNLPSFVQQMLTGGSTATMTGPQPGAQPSSAMSLGSLGNQVTTGNYGVQATPGGTAPGTSNINNAVSGIRSLYEQGGNALAPQAVEGMTDTEKAMFTGAGADLGYDVPGWMAAYNRSRIGQQTATPGMT